MAEESAQQSVGLFRSASDEGCSMSSKPGCVDKKGLLSTGSFDPTCCWCECVKRAQCYVSYWDYVTCLDEMSNAHKSKCLVGVARLINSSSKDVSRVPLWSVLLVSTLHGFRLLSVSLASFGKSQQKRNHHDSFSGSEEPGSAHIFVIQ